MSTSLRKSAERRSAEHWMIISRTMGLLPAQVIQGRLETAQIPVILDYDSTQSLLGIPVFGGTGEVRILVPSDRTAEARELLKA